MGGADTKRWETNQNYMKGEQSKAEKCRQERRTETSRGMRTSSREERASREQR
jgi:hypothetical protein